MLRVASFASLLVLMLQLPVAAQETAVGTTFPQKLERLELQDGDSIVFLGDSITHQRLYTQYVEDYFYTRFPHLRLKLHNAGVGGARAWDALQRFDKDVAAYKPKYVTILLGMNDGSYRPYDDAVFKTYRQDMTTILDKLAGIGATAIPMTPTMFDARAKRLSKNPGNNEESILLYNSVLAYYGAWLREVASDRGLGFVDMYTPLNQQTLESRETDPKFTLMHDGVHPEQNGQVIMAAAVISDLELPKLVSKIQVTMKPNGEAKSSVANGKLENLAVANGGISFQFTARSLPWVLPGEAQEGAALAHLGHRLGRESLRVSGLASGKYLLKIEGVDAGTYDAVELADTIELQGNHKTPQYQQALQVAELNKKRNDGPVGQLRGEWLKFQAYARLKREHEAQPDNQDVAAKFMQAGKAIEGMDERVVQINAAAKAIEDEIFKINQPKTLTYTIEPVK